MSDVFGRRTNLVAVLVAGAIFFTALGFFVATGFDRPTASQAQQLWTEGTGTTDAQRVPSFTPVAQKLEPAVVRILVEGEVTAGTGTTLPPSTTPTTAPGQAPAPFSPDSPLPPNHPPLSAEGSGVIISSSGYILTNNHVIEGASSITVTDSEGNDYEGRVIGADARDDLALVKIDAGKELPVAPFGDSEKIQPGDWVMAIGNPLGLDFSVTVGVVSGKGRSLDASSNFRDFIQTDAAIYPGNSGGPLINLAGEVVGINTAVIPDTNLGFAVPINTAKEIIPQLLQDGKVVRGYLGVSIESVEDAVTPPRGATEGAIVQEIRAGGPGAKAGFEVGDVIVSFDGRPVASATELVNLVTGTKPDSKVEIGIVRDGEKKTLQATVGTLPPELE